MSTICAEQIAIPTIGPDDHIKGISSLRQSWAPTGPITLTAADPKWKLLTSITSNDDDILSSFVKQWNGKRGLFFQVNETANFQGGEGVRPAKKDVTALRGLHLDADVKTLPEVFDITARSIQDLILNPPDGLPIPTLLTATGGGFHGLYRFPEQLPATPDNIALVEGLNRLLEGTFVDPDGTHNVDRILRVPYTVNLPNEQKRRDHGRVPSRVELIECNSGTVDVSKLRAVPPPAPTSKAQTKHQVVDVPIVTDVAELGLTLDRDADWDLLALIAWTPGLGYGFEKPPELHDSDKQYLFEQPGVAGKGKRSERVKSVVDRLLSRKVPAEKIVGTLMNPNWGLYDHIKDHGGLSYAWHQLRHEAEPVRSPKLVALTPIPDDLAPAPVLVPSLLIDGFVTVLGGRGGVGKSLFQLHVAVGVALGAPFLGYEPKEARKVLLINPEDDLREKQHRLWAVCRQMGVDPVVLNDKLFTIAVPRTELFEAKFDDKGHRSIGPTPFCNELQDLIKSQGIGLVMVDPMAELHLGIDENNNTDMKELMIGIRKIAASHGISMLVAHHTRKGASAEGAEQDAFRGAGAIINAARIGVLMEPMGTDMADKLLPKNANRRDYVIVTDAKTNYFKAQAERVLQFSEHMHPTAGPRAAFVVPVFDASTPDTWKHTAAVLAEVQARMTDRPFGTGTTGPKGNRLDAWIVDNCPDTRKADVVGLIKALEAAGSIRRARWMDGKREVKEVWAVPGVELPNEVGDLPLP